ncbi:MAG: methionine--tRNA ligase [Deltaproteobacteria bacterium]|nr:methionine--tRNA ligase [Deltaproteobacteria bacterium]
MKPSKPFYVTTPIYYVNDRPHIGHAYSTIAADVLARYHRLRGVPTRFLTGLDEHGLKIERRAKEMGKEPQAFVDSMAAPFREAWDVLECTPDDFIRTTEPRHEALVQQLWTRLEQAGDIYLGDYEDWYCVGCESFKTEKELLEGNLCPVHKKPVEKVKEQSYFFRLSAYTERLLEFYESHPTFVRPAGRFNEVKSFVREGLRDLSISRTSFRWGVPVPGNDEHVMYVWLDALTNYISALGGPAAEAPLYKQFWGEDATQVHIVGKDILRFHAVYWPAFLLSAGIAPPTQVWAHGWLTVDGEKMSKSLGNFLPPAPLAEAFGTDALRYYLMRGVAFGQDGDFSHEALVARYNGELGNGLGNLLNRVLSIVKKNLGGVVPDSPRIGGVVEIATEDGPIYEQLDRTLEQKAQEAARESARWLEEVNPGRALDAIWKLVAEANGYIDRTEPWSLAKRGETGRLGVVMYSVLETLRWLSVMIWPFMPERAEALRTQLGLKALEDREKDVDVWPAHFGELPAGTQTALGTPLFPRIDDDEKARIFASLGLGRDKESDRMSEQQEGPGAPSASGATQNSEPAIAADATPPEPFAPDMSFDDFMKVDLRVGLILSAEKVKKSKKLLCLQIDLGEKGPRQILAGISAHYQPEALVGRRVVVVANLPPRKMMGLESQGMVLAARDEVGLGVLSPLHDAQPGTRVS